MTSIALNQELVERLTEATDVVELTDHDGNVIGSFVPSSYRHPPYDPGLLPSPLPEEEIQRRLAEQPYLTTAQVLEHLRSLE